MQSDVPGLCARNREHVEQAAQTFGLPIAPGERDFLHQMQVPLAPLVWLDTESTSRGQSSDSSVPRWRAVVHPTLSNSVALESGRALHQATSHLAVQLLRLAKQPERQLPRRSIMEPRAWSVAILAQAAAMLVKHLLYPVRFQLYSLHDTGLGSRPDP